MFFPLSILSPVLIPGFVPIVELGLMPVFIALLEAWVVKVFADIVFLLFYSSDFVSFVAGLLRAGVIVFAPTLVSSLGVFVFGVLFVTLFVAGFFSTFGVVIIDGFSVSALVSLAVLPAVAGTVPVFGLTSGFFIFDGFIDL